MDLRSFSANWARALAVVGLFALAIFIAMVALSSGHADAKTITIASDKAGKEGLVAGALQAASDGDTISLSGGFFYEENLTVSKRVMFLSDESSVVSAYSIKVTARNVTFHDMAMVLRSGVLKLEADNWTFEGTVLQECLGTTCIRADSADGGLIRNSTFMGTNGDAIQIYGSRGITISDAYISAGVSGIRLNGTKDAWLFGLRMTQASLGVYLTWCENVTVDYSVLDTVSYGFLAANCTNLTIKGSLVMSNAGYLNNYGVYLAFGKGISIINNTFDGDAAGVAAYKASNVLVKWNTVEDNLEGIWSYETSMTLLENAIFGNLRFGMNVTGLTVNAGNNFWGTDSATEAQKAVRGPVMIQPIKIADPTPDDTPVMLSPVPNITNGTEDQTGKTLLEVGPYFSDETWYIQAWTPRPSSVRFTVIYNTDPKNVSIEVAESGTCAGTCKNAEGELRATTAVNWYGTVSVKLRATDWRGKHVDSNTFTITFIPVNDRPVVDIPGLPKNSLIEVHGGEERQFDVTVYDDSPTVTVELKVDDGAWVPVEQNMACAQRNSTKLKDLPYCTRAFVTLKANDKLDVGMHNVSFRACDGEHCSDETGTGKYDIQFYDMGSPGKDFSPTGVSFALVMLVLMAIVVVAMSSPSKEKPKKVEGERPVAASSEEE